MNRRECKTQAEVDAAVAAGDGVVVRDSASVSASDSASVSAYDSASVSASGSASVSASGSASVSASGSARVYAYGSARVYASDSASVIDGRSTRPLHQHRPVLLIGPIGSRRTMLTARFPVEGDVILETGCFYGSPAEFRTALAKTHPTGQYADEYAAALTMIEAIAGRAL